jgi:hypothetical protein
VEVKKQVHQQLADEWMGESDEPCPPTAPKLPKLRYSGQSTEKKGYRREEGEVSKRRNRERTPLHAVKDGC